MTVNTLGTHEQDRSSRTAAEWLWPLLPIGVSVFFLSALVYYHLRHDAIEVRSVLQVAVAGIYRIAGFAPAVLCFLLALTWSSIWFATGQLERPLSRALRLLAMTVMLSVFLNVGDGGVTWYPHKGELGAWLAGTLLSSFGYLPSLVLVWAVTFASLLLATDFFFSESFERLRQLPADSGVEVAVTDHLRGLAQSGPQPDSRAQGMAPGAADPLATVGDLATAAGLERGAPAAPPTTENVPDVEEPRRRTYAERRAQREQTQPGAERPFGSAEWAPVEVDPVEVDPVEVDPVEVDPVEPRTGEIGSESGAGDEAMAGKETEAVSEAKADAAADEIEPAEPEVLGPEVSDEESEESDDDGGFVGGTAAREAAADELRLPEPDDASSEEPLVQIPRLDVPPVWREPTAPGETRGVEEPSERASGRQQELFAAGIDEALIQEAIELVTSTRRASATLLQRKLRIDYARAIELLSELAARGLVALEGDASQGRVLGP